MTRLSTVFPFDRWTMLVLLGVLTLVGTIVLIDLNVKWTIFLFYLLPVVMVAWMVRGAWWVLVSLLAAGLWYMSRYIAPPDDAARLETLGAGLMNMAQRAGVLLVVGALCAKLRAVSMSPGSLASSHDASGMLSLAGLRDAASAKSVTDRMNAGPCALLLIDVDRKVSAFLGQGAEHAALAGAMIAKAMMERARPTDLTARLSPNHFLLVMPGVTEPEAQAVCAAIRDELPRICESLGGSIGTHSLLLTAERPPPGGRLETLLAHAENRLVTLKVLDPARHHDERWTSQERMGAHGIFAA